MPLPTSSVRIREAVAEGAAGRPSRFDVPDWAIQKGEGQLRWVAIEVTPFPSESSGTVARLAIAGGDITEHVFEFVNAAHVRALGFGATGMAVRQAQPESVEVHGILDEVYRTGVTAKLREIPVTVTATRLRRDVPLAPLPRRPASGREGRRQALGWLLL